MSKRERLATPYPANAPGCDATGQPKPEAEAQPRRVHYSETCPLPHPGASGSWPLWFDLDSQQYGCDWHGGEEHRFSELPAAPGQNRDETAPNLENLPAISVDFPSQKPNRELTPPAQAQAREVGRTVPESQIGICAATAEELEPSAAMGETFLLLPDGSARVTVTIPERHTQAILAEAEVQQKPPAQYFADWLNFVLDAGWGR